MANAEHLAILKEGVEVWNKWRKKNKNINPDLSIADLQCANMVGADLRRVNLSKANLRSADMRRADLRKANLREANLNKAKLRGADLRSADLYKVNLRRANLSEANLHNASLCEANLSKANLSRVNLTIANFSGAILTDSSLLRATVIGTDFSRANLERIKIYGASVWDIKKEGAVQKDLIITKDKEPVITVDNLEIAQFIHLLLNNQKFRDVIETITSKAVLILGRFTNERKQVLDAIRDELRNRDFLPILFDFEKPATRDLTETISILAKLSRFVIADLTDAKSIPQELSHIIPFMPNLPVIPIILQGQREYAMFEHWRPYPWVLPIYEYESEGHLISTLSAGVIEPAERKVQEIRGR